MDLGKQFSDPEKPEKNEPVAKDYVLPTSEIGKPIEGGRKATEAARIAQEAATEVKEAAGRVEAAAKAVTEQAGEFRQALEDVKGLREDIRQLREAGSSGDQRQFAPLTDDEIQNLRVIEIRLHDGLGQVGQVASEVANEWRAQGREDFARQTQRIKEDASRWRNQTTVILSVPDEQVRLRIALSVAYPMEAERSGAEETIDEAKKAGVDASQPVLGKMTRLRDWLTKGPWRVVEFRQGSTDSQRMDAQGQN